MAMLFWGTARILTEVTFKVQPSTGALSYDWGSLSACIAALCLLLCLACVFWACLPMTSPVPTADEAAGPDGPAEWAAQQEESASERIKHLIEDRDAQAD